MNSRKMVFCTLRALRFILLLIFFSAGLSGCVVTQRVSYDNSMQYGAEGSDLSYLVVRNRFGYYEYCDKTGKVLINPWFRRARPFYEGLAAVKDGDLFGYIDITGKIVIPCKYIDALDFHNGKALVGTSIETYQENSYVRREKVKYSFIDKNGNLINETEYYLVGDYSDGWAPVSSDNGYFYINLDNVETIPLPQFNSFGEFPSFHDGFAVLNSPDKDHYFIDKTGTRVFPNGFYSAMSFSDGYAAVRIDKNDKPWGYIDKTGQIVIKPQYQDASGFGEGLACVLTSDIGWIIINKSGEKICALQTNISKADVFSEGLCAVAITKKVKNSQSLQYYWGFIDTSGKVVIDYQYNKVTSFINGIAQVMIDGKIGYIDKTGKYIWEPK